MNFEIDDTRRQLNELKEELRNYLVNSYNKRDKEKKAEKTFKYLEMVVDTICKRNSFSITFNGGADPMWHSEVFSYISRWINLEEKLNSWLILELEDLETN